MSQALHARDLDEIFTKAKDIKADLWADLEMHPGEGIMPPWLLSIKTSVQSADDGYNIIST